MKNGILTCLFFLFSFSVLPAQGLDGNQIIKRVNDLLNVETNIGKSEMTIVTSSGKTRTFVFQSWSKDRGEKNLIRYLEPSRVKGQATLMLNNADDIWMFFPRTQRVRKLATHAKKQKMEGSDFSYEDLGSGDSFVEDFTAKRLNDEFVDDVDCYKIELTRIPQSDISYSRLIMWIIKKNFYPVKIDYYDEDDPSYHEKRLIQSNIMSVDGIPTAMKSVMYNQNDNTQTELRILEIKYNVQLDDDMFTERALKK